MIVTCHTEGCGNADEPIDLGDPPVIEGVADPFGTVICGVCAQEITDKA